MPTYVYTCPAGHITEVTLPAEKRDSPRRCKCKRRMKRKLTTPMATLWRGKFQGRWNKVAEGDW